MTDNNPLDIDRCTQTHEYRQSTTEITVYRGGKYHGRMRRCGITAPHYAERPTYKLCHLGGLMGEEVYVYDSGYFWQSRAWHAFCRENGGVTPGEIAEMADGEMEATQ